MSPLVRAFALFDHITVLYQDSLLCGCAYVAAAFRAGPVPGATAVRAVRLPATARQFLKVDVAASRARCAHDRSGFAHRSAMGSPMPR